MPQYRLARGTHGGRNARIRSLEGRQHGLDKEVRIDVRIDSRAASALGATGRLVRSGGCRPFKLRGGFASDR